MKIGGQLDAARNARGKVRGKVRGALPRTPARGDTPLRPPGPLSLLPHVSEWSSPSRGCCGKSFQTRKRFSFAAHKPRALDGSGPFRRWTGIRESGQVQSLFAAPPASRRSELRDNLE